MDGRSNADLNGIMFADVPWVIDPQPWIENLPQQYAEFWPDERRLARLHAMGYDAYNLIAALYSSRGQNVADFDGATGRLSLDAAGKVRRQLAWAQFQNDTIVSLPGKEPLGGPIQDRTDDSELVLPRDADDAPWDATRQEP